MFLMILFTIFTCTLVQILITNPNKLLTILLYLSRLSFMMQYVPKFNKLLEFYTASNLCPSGNPIFTNNVFSGIDKLFKDKNIESTLTVKTFDELLKEYENINDTKVIFINHGISKSPFSTYLATQDSLKLEDSSKFVNILSSIDENKTITLVIHTCGGMLQATEIIINALLNHKGKIKVYIPYYAMSSGTLIALAGHEIYIDKNACLGPIDPQIYGCSAVNFVNYCQELDTKEQYSFIKDIVKLCSKTASASVTRTKDVIKTICDKRGLEIKNIEDVLLFGNHNHDKPFFIDELTKILSNIQIGIPNELLNLYANFVKNI